MIYWINLSLSALEYIYEHYGFAEPLVSFMIYANNKFLSLIFFCSSSLYFILYSKAFRCLAHRYVPYVLVLVVRLFIYFQRKLIFILKQFNKTIVRSSQILLASLIMVCKTVSESI